MRTVIAAKRRATIGMQRQLPDSIGQIETIETHDSVEFGKNGFFARSSVVVSSSLAWPICSEHRWGQEID